MLHSVVRLKLGLEVTGQNGVATLKQAAKLKKVISGQPNLDLELTDEHEDLVVRISQQGGHRHSLKYKTFHPVQISISF